MRRQVGRARDVNYGGVQRRQGDAFTVQVATQSTN